MKASIKARLHDVFHDFDVDKGAGKFPQHVGAPRLQLELKAKSRYALPCPFVIPLSCPCRGRSAAFKRDFIHQQPMENAS